MSQKRRIKISRIENDMLNIGCDISIIKSLSSILYDCFNTGEFKNRDLSSLIFIIDKQLQALKTNFNHVEEILKI